ncbi:colorectal cancer associated 2 [Syngnathoides biaculeatus]|uniref:colorectal cancer associated 2 n=1 Tax=Syngnathoides biaculeatus TaxID=300417 RepID=UPI002ADD9775|nr:colorectal cancer associated 2 [Syngnathoides biaculeatus]
MRVAPLPPPSPHSQPYPNADKPRVYQGVRVKTTVKELLQRHRAREANRKKGKTISQGCLDLPALCASTPPTLSYAEPLSAPIADPGSCGSAALLPRPASYPVSDIGCSIPAQEGNFAFGDMIGPTDCYGANNNSGDCYESAVPHPPSFPLPWSHDLASDSDNFGHALAPCSSLESLQLCSPLDPNSYSPQDSFSSSSSSSCYDSPTRMECNFIGYASDHCHNQHCTLQNCCCLTQCRANPKESFCAPEYSPYYPPTNYSYPCLVEENYFKNNFAMSTEMCYNVL